MKKDLQTKFSTRQYMQMQDFELYYYSDKGLTGVGSHTHTYYEFYLFLEGDVILEIDKHSYPLTPGDIILIPPGIAHHAKINGDDVPYRRFVFWVSTAYLERLANASASYGYLIHRAKDRKKYIFHNDIIAFHAIQSRVFELIEEMHEQRFGKEETISLCVDGLILHLNRTAYEQEHPKSRKEKQSLYQNLISYIDEHLDEDLSLESLSIHFFVSKYHIAHIYMENIGCSNQRYITKKRLEACRNALSSQTKVSSVYSMYGFKDYSSFYRSFQKEYGMSPKEYQDSRLHPELTSNVPSNS